MTDATPQPPTRQPTVVFYDVPPEGIAALVVKLVEAAWHKGKRLIIFVADPDEAGAIDAHLWTYKDEAFIPHEVIGRDAVPGDPEAPPIAITSAELNPIGASILLQASPAGMDFARGFDVVLDIVDHRSDEALAASRGRFRAWREAGAAPRFIKQEPPHRAV